MKKFIILILVVILAIGGYFGYKKFYKGEDTPFDKIIEKVEKKKLKIFDEDSNERTIAVMINNNHSAWPHAGLQDSFLNYEIIAEGGITRIMALYKGESKLPEKIGSVRSSRPYFLDYALENDAIYIHWGGSDQAYNDLSSLKMEHVDGIYYEGTYFYREEDYSRAYEHTGFTKGSMIKEAISDLEFRNTTDSKPLLNYSVDEINFQDNAEALKADTVEIGYSYYTSTKYEYDSENKVYLRSMSTYDEYEPHTDAVTEKQYTAKNIITYKVQNESLDYADRQALYNIGSGEGYYITNGYAVPITWEKSSRSGKTTYKYASTGEEIKVNDGNTWIQIQPEDKYLGITGVAETEEITE